MTPAELERELSSGKIRPVYLICGEERVLADRSVQRLRAVAVDAAPDFNEERLSAGEARIERILSAARMMPMMARRRVVIVRGVERWDGSAEDRADASDEDGPSREGTPLDRLADYAANPVETTCLVLVAGKLDARRRLLVLAKKAGFLVSCDQLDDAALADFARRAVEERGCKLSSRVADVLVQVAGPDLAYVLDAVERLTLLAGPGGEITEDTVSEVVVRVRETSVFALVGAVGRKDAKAALTLLADVYDPRDRGLPLVGMLAWSVRQLLKFDAAIRDHARPEDAAKAAGAPPFKARELATQLKGLTTHDLERWLRLLAEADLALKGSKRPPRAVLETMILAMVR